MARYSPRRTPPALTPPPCQSPVEVTHVLPGFNCRRTDAQKVSRGGSAMAVRGPDPQGGGDCTLSFQDLSGVFQRVVHGLLVGREQPLVGRELTQN